MAPNAQPRRAQPKEGRLAAFGARVVGSRQLNRNSGANGYGVLDAMHIRYKALSGRLLFCTLDWSDYA